MNTSPNRKSGWRWLRRGLIVLAALVTLAAVLVTEENWRGKRAWTNYQRAAAARGEQLALASIIPPPVPDDRNFYCAPIVAEAFQNARQPGGAGVSRLNFSLYRGDSKLWPAHGGDWRKGTFTDLNQWQAYFQNYNATPEGRTNGFPAPAQPGQPAADVLTALSVFNPAVEELRLAATRPEMRMPINYEDGFEATRKLLPWLAGTKQCGQLLQLRILAEMDADRPAAALDDIKLNMRVIDSIRLPHYLISELVRIALMHIVLQPVYEGLARHVWTDSQLAQLADELAREDMLASWVSSLDVEKVCALDQLEKQRRTRKIQYVDDSAGTNQVITVNLRWTPEAFFYQGQYSVAWMHDQYVAPLVDLTQREVSPSVFERINNEVKAQTKHYSPYQFQALMTVPAIVGGVKKVAMIQSGLDLARVACALERFRLAHGRYPETLAELTPRFAAALPHDLINGQPLRYHRANDDKYVLYSVGWDEKDDGGQVTLSKEGRANWEKGDWVWKF